MWAGLKHCAVEGGPLDVLVEVNLCARPAQSGFVVPIFHWQTVEEESDELEAVLKARVRKAMVNLNVRHEGGAGNQPPPPALPSLSACLSSFAFNAWWVLTRFPTVEKVGLGMGEGVSCDRGMLMACAQGLGFPGSAMAKSVSGNSTIVFERGERPCERDSFAGGVPVCEDSEAMDSQPVA
mmetsp:Transcript_28983/g.83745  ORF Transcript_28983/g.83745 Transcript_28983/m.83745 type:complete len:181 (+) Transcript_28983:3-545(+)